MINIYGNGGHAKVISSILYKTHPKQIKFWDDASYEKEVGDFDPYNNNIEGNWLIAIGNNNSRKRIAELLGNDCYITLIHESAVLDRNINPGKGSQILHNSTIQVGTKIGKHCIINTASSIDHDCVLGDFSFIGPNATLCGGVKIGEGTFIGAGAIVLPYIKIGKNCMIGAGSVVTKNLPDGITAYGNPVKIKL
jgi:sugar O-acyltransferase (sialic acid O-acetyltransferase NeuD family)|tara:strand:+ start:107 stop:688 length:582 start_codon:yes stop_codon:yes gene_type:complete